MTNPSVTAAGTSVNTAAPSSTLVPLSRRHFTRQRRALTAQQRWLDATLASTHLPKLIGRLPKQAQVGLYYDDFGELPTQPILDWCLRLGYLGYLPVVGSLGRQSGSLADQNNGANKQLDKRLRFAPINQSKLCQLTHTRHALGMKQLNSRQLLWASELDIIFCPLVAADLNGNRMGMGGGFYDSTLKDVNRIGRNRTLIIGWCYDFQLVDRLERQPWDVPLDGLITPKSLRWFR